jgi:hypothetical protein
MPVGHPIIAHPWQTAYTIWGGSAVLNPVIYMAALGLFGGGTGIEFSIAIGLVSAMLSLPTIVALRWVLPPLLALRMRNGRIIGVAGSVVLLFFMLAVPFGMACSIGADDANSVQLNWRAVCALLFFASPCLIGSLIVTGYVCRTLLFRSDFAHQ